MPTLREGKAEPLALVDPLRTYLGGDGPCEAVARTAGNDGNGNGAARPPVFPSEKSSFLVEWE